MRHGRNSQGEQKPRNLAVTFLPNPESATMDNQSFDDKSFVPQLLLAGEPSSEWGPDELGRYAQAQNQQINDSEKLLSPVYWRMGKTLTLAKKHFDHGQWTKFLESWGIDRTRAAKARAIFGAFGSEQAVLGLS